MNLVSNCAGVPMAIKPWKPLNLCAACARWSGTAQGNRGPARHDGREWRCVEFKAKAP